MAQLAPFIQSSLGLTNASSPVFARVMVDEPWSVGRGEFAETIPLAQAPRWYRAALMKLTELKGLAAGWGEASSVAPSNAAFDTAQAVLGSVAQEPWLPKPHIAPIFDGGLLFEWRLGDRDLTVEAMADGRVGVMRGDDRGAIDEESPEFSARAFRQLIHWLQFGDPLR